MAKTNEDFTVTISALKEDLSIREDQLDGIIHSLYESFVEMCLDSDSSEENIRAVCNVLTDLQRKTLARERKTAMIVHYLSGECSDLKSSLKKAHRSEVVHALS